MAEATGLLAVLDEMGVTDQPPAPEAEQLDLLGLPVAHIVGGEVRPRGPGRPPGARNRRTEDWEAYLSTRYTHPLETLAQISAQSVDALSKALGCKPLEALQEKRLAAIALLPFMAQRRPLALDVSNHEVVHLTINTGAAGAAETQPSEGGMTLVSHVVEVIENQQVSEGSDEAV